MVVSLMTRIFFTVPALDTAEADIVSGHQAVGIGEPGPQFEMGAEDILVLPDDIEGRDEHKETCQHQQA